MTTCWTEIPSLGNIDRYLDAIKGFPMLTLEEEQNAVNEGDLGKLKLILSHLRLAASMARNYSVSSGNLASDLIQEANVGLIMAASKFDPEQGRFSSYATFWIRSALNEFVTNNTRIVRIATTKAMKKAFFSMGKYRNEKERATGRRTFSEEDYVRIAAELSTPSIPVKPEEVKEMDTRLSGGDLMLDPLISDDDENSKHTMGNYLGDVRDNPEVVFAQAERYWLETEGVEEALALLTEREQFIIRNRYMVPEEEQLNLTDLSKIFAVSYQRIGQIEAKALKAMRKHLQEYA